jgi:hypothetical protein
MSLLGALFLDLVRAFFRVHAIAGELAHSWIQEIGASLEYADGVPARHEAVAVVLDLVNPVRPRRGTLGGGR